MIAANLAAPYHAALASARVMLTQPADDGIKGKIVILGDWATERPYKDYLPYLVAKGGSHDDDLGARQGACPAYSRRPDPARDDRPAP